MKIAFLLYPTTKVKIQEDSSFWIMRELVARGHQVFYFESRHLFWVKSSPHAFLTKAKLSLKHGYLPSSPEKLAVSLDTLQCIFIRKEPPFDLGYLYALQMLNEIRNKVFILNDPEGIALSNEKLFSVIFKQYAPLSLVTENVSLAKDFIRNLEKAVVIKPLDDKGGTGIFALGPKDRNLSSLLDTATERGQKKVMVQQLIEADHGSDKRILILNGEILGAFLRRPPAWDFRANLSIGGSMHKASVTRSDKKLVAAITPELLSRGLFFVGIDVMGKCLTEVNVTSPAGIPEINHFNRTTLQKKVADFIEQKLAGRRHSSGWRPPNP